MARAAQPKKSLSKIAQAERPVRCLYLWSPSRFAWAPLIVAVTKLGHDLIPQFRAQLDDYGFRTALADVGSDDQSLIDSIGAAMPAPQWAAEIERLDPHTKTPATAQGVKPDPQAVPVLYVWSDMRGVWKPLLVAITPLGREAVLTLGGHLMDAGLSTFLASVSADDARTIIATSRELRPPANAGFIDYAPDGIIDDDLIALASPLN